MANAIPAPFTSLVLGVALTVALAGCALPTRKSNAELGGDPAQGAILMVRESCGACHEIPGIQLAHGQVGPPLAGFARRTMVAGYLPNTPQNLANWIRTPQAYAPGNAMPNLAISRKQAADMAAYLETLG